MNSLKHIWNNIMVFIRFLIRSAARIRKDNITAYSAHAAFFIFISAFPFLIILLTCIKYTPLTKDTLFLILNNATPGIVSDTLNAWIDEIYSESAGILSASILIALWSASKGFFGIASSLNNIYHGDYKLNYFLYRLLSMLYTIVFLIVSLATMLLLVFGRTVSNWLIDRFEVSSELFQTILDFRIIIALAIFFALILAMYILLPNRKTKIRYELPGTLFTTIGWITFSTVYSHYLEYSYDNSIYGSVSAIVFFMLWLYFSIYILFFGAEINRYYRRIREKSHSVR